MSKKILNVFFIIFPLCGAAVHFLLAIHHNGMLPEQSRSDLGNNLFLASLALPSYILLYGILLTVTKNISKVIIGAGFMAMMAFDYYAYFSNPSLASRGWLLVLVPIVFLLPASATGGLLILFLDKRKKRGY